MKRLLRSTAEALGRLTGLRRLPSLEKASWVLDFYDFRRRNEDVSQFADRYGLYKHLNKEVIRDEAICYLEFGVYNGDSFRKWVELNKNPESRFFGFDTFEGLPEKWDMGSGAVMDKGTFDTGGQTPECADSRATFVKGVFQATLLPFLAAGLPPHQRLVLHMDADLYSSTLFCLAQLYPHIVPGTLIVFDELVNSIHEYRALQDWSQSHLVDYKVLGATPRFEQAAVEVTRKRLHYRD